MHDLVSSDRFGPVDLGQWVLAAVVGLGVVIFRQYLRTHPVRPAASGRRR